MCKQARESNINREMNKSTKRKGERDLRFTMCTTGMCILETIWRGLFGTGTQRLQPTKQDSSGATNPTQLWGNELSWEIVEYQAAFPELYSHVRSRACACFLCVRQKRLRKSAHQSFSHQNSSYILKWNIIEHTEDETLMRVTIWSRKNTTFT